ncbi:hypothetical protein DY000_02034541 [Brassica cretica]|uniref:Uncharacterized protein n=1 Tax=Brassica cretica TaxID=69181 RepID=A0ABQ7DQ27_BRACR|nr:hypothetical protein DY000_02034541 [Brassica cretica]
MKSSEYPEEFPRIFRGNTKFWFLGISSEYTDGIPRKYQSVGIFLWNTEEKGPRSSEIPDEHSEEYFVETSEDWTIGISSKYSEEGVPRYIPRNLPTNLLSSEFPRNLFSSEFRRKFPRDFRGNMNFRGVISEDFFRRYVLGIALFRRHTDDLFPQYAAVFL